MVLFFLDIDCSKQFSKNTFATTDDFDKGMFRAKKKKKKWVLSVPGCLILCLFVCCFSSHVFTLTETTPLPGKDYNF